MSILEVTVISATNLPNVEKFSKSDPYAIVIFQGVKKKTKVIDDDLNPEWNEKLEFDLQGTPLSSSDNLTIIVKDYENIGTDRLLGQTEVALKDLTKGKNEMKLNVNLVDSNKRLNSATINIHIVYKAPKSASPNSSGVSKAEDTVDNNLQLEDEVDADVDENEQQSGNDDEGRDDIDGRAGKVKRRKVKAGRRNVRSKWGTKSQDFQIRVKIVEARQLQGANISPVCGVTCWNQSKQTRVKKSTNAPFFNETFFFNFHASPATLFDEFISFNVLNSRQLRSDALIGSFKFDIGMIYEENAHCFMNKWLLLCDPEDPMAGAKGYLKICVVVLGPGDEAPSFNKTKSEGDNEDDIESNLLRPAGVQLRPATFKLRIYRAEDLPRMDSDVLSGIKKVFNGSVKKELVDPYMVFNFAGKQVKTTTKYNNDHPEWNEELSVGLQFPSMCERIKLQMFDWDRITRNDIIATTSIAMNQICSYEEKCGYLPTFGPCFINFYGSPREFVELTDDLEILNKGIGEGVAYRGRVLAEFHTVLGETPDVSQCEIAPEELLKVQKYLRRRKFRLHSIFLNANMITAVDSTVEFEVSIGNYGNMMDPNVPASCSTTQPTNAVFDGKFYYFLPWGKNKPYCVVDSHWEDIEYRLFAVNFFLRIIDSLEAELVKIRIAQQANLQEEEQAQFVIFAIDQLISALNKEFPQWEPGQSPETELDLNLKSLRLSEIQNVRREAMRLREEATSVEIAVNELENYANQLKALVHEPQNSMPDVVIWLISGEKRMAYCRLPAYDILYSKNEAYRGRLCGKVQTLYLKYPAKKDLEEKWQIPAQLRVMIWLGLEKEESEWHRMQTDGELMIMAETYENEWSQLGTWTKKCLHASRPAWSDAAGRCEIAKDKLQPPEGWKWAGDWFLSPEVSMFYDKDAGLAEYVEDVFVNECRLPGQAWSPATPQFTDVKGDPCNGLDEIVCPLSWEWVDEAWVVDLNRSCDDEGWEYTVEMSMGGYVPVEKMYHMSRRRRFVRLRRLVADEKNKPIMIDPEATAAKPEMCWEYATMFTLKFHTKERKMDMVRRRRWHRRMISTTPGSSCIFQPIDSSDQEHVKENKEKKDSKKKNKMIVPRMFLSCKNSQTWHLRAYIYQARNLLSGDQTGLSDPYARVVFHTKSSMTERIEATLSPTWDQTLIFNDVQIYSDPQTIAMHPPQVVVEIFDYDQLGVDEFLGRTLIQPMVKLNLEDTKRPVLQWYPIKKGNVEGGELLAAFELLYTNGRKMPPLPPRNNANLYPVPDGIRPIMQRTGIEVLSWGVRNMKKFQLMSVTSPSIEFEIGGQVRHSEVIKNTKRNPNFAHPFLFFDVMLPKEELYMPPMNIRVRDNRQFGRKPMIGLHCQKSLDFFCVPPLTENVDLLVDILGVVNSSPTTSADVVLELPDSTSVKKKVNVAQLDENIDWWSKYYASVGDLTKCRTYNEMGYDVLKVHKCELEKVADYNNFTDFCKTFEIYRGKNLDDEESNVVGEFKGTFRVYPLPENSTDSLPLKHLEKRIPDSSPVECLIRLYVIKAFDLQPNDPSGLADPYLEVQLGNKKLDTKEFYIANNLSPDFGRMFELKCKIPLQKDLIVRVKDYDLLSLDDVIGETKIDLENRLLTKFRGTCGIPQTYCVDGPNQWRDCQKPKDILNEYCTKNNIPLPEYIGNAALRIGKRTFSLSDFEHGQVTNPHLGGAEERLALHLLNKLPLVKEHVEQRPLFSPLQPGIEQGKIQLWVDIFPMSLGPPGPPFNIKPREPTEYVLRVIVWNTEDVILDEKNIMGEKMSDIYVKGWMTGIDEKQETDVHYRSLDGTGNFNWRFCFPFQYQAAENAMVVKKKEHFWSLDSTEQRLPPNIVLQVWDNDNFSADDFLGTLQLNLNWMPTPSKKAGSCSLKQLPQFNKECKMTNLFDCKRAYGFWPFYSDETGEAKLTGKIEMELELITKEEAGVRPAGVGRDEPNENPHLDPPNRPATSFMWFSSPWKSFKFIVWKRFKCYIISAILIILLALLIFLFIYATPGLLSRKMIGV